MYVFLSARIRFVVFLFFFFQAEDGIRDLVRSRGLGDVYKRQGGARGPEPLARRVRRVQGEGLDHDGALVVQPDPERLSLLRLSLIHI